MLKRLDFKGKGVNFPEPTLAPFYRKPLQNFLMGKKLEENR
jgi:hypothetical protein